MYETYYHLKTKPFTLLPDPEFLYLSTKHKMALSLLEYGLSSGASFFVITGDPGTGKTTLLNQLLDQSGHPWTIGMISNVHVGWSELLPWVSASFGLTTKDRNPVEAFHDFVGFLEEEQAAGKRVLLILDEAQNLNASMLEELRLLSNVNNARRRSLQILLSGQSSLRDLLVGPGMVQFAQRIGVESVLDGLSEEETGAYIHHRLQIAGRETPLFSTLAGRMVFLLTGGLPRLVNQVCDHALVYGYAEQADWVTARIVLNAASARARLGMLPLVTSPEKISLSEGDLGAEQAEQATFKNEVSRPSTKENIALSNTKLGTARAEQGTVTTKVSPTSGDHDMTVSHNDRGTAQPERTAANSEVTCISTEAMKPPQQDSLLDPTSVYREGLGLKNAGKYENAIRLFEMLIEHNIWGVKALAQKGLCLNAMGHYDDALAAIRSAVERQSATRDEIPSLRYLLARILESRGSLTEARHVYQILACGNPPYRDSPERLARLNHAAQGNGGLGHKETTKIAAFRRGCEELLRGMQR